MVVAAVLAGVLAAIPAAQQPPQLSTAPRTIAFQGREIPNHLDEILDPKHTAVIVHEMLNDFISPGGEYDNWDLEIQSSLFGGARLLMAVEDHGAGAQYVRFRVWPKWSAGLLFVALVVVCLSGAAELNGVWLVCALLGFPALLLITTSVRHCGGAMAAFLHAIALQTGDVPVAAASTISPTAAHV